MSDTISFKKKRKRSRVKHREGEIFSYSFIWHGSFVILREILCTFCFCPWAAIEVRREICCMCLNQYSLTYHDSTSRVNLWLDELKCRLNMGNPKKDSNFVSYYWIINAWYVLDFSDPLHYTIAEGINQNASEIKKTVSLYMSGWGGGGGGGGARKSRADQSSARRLDALHLSRCSLPAKRIGTLKGEQTGSLSLIVQRKHNKMRKHK